MIESLDREARRLGPGQGVRGWPAVQASIMSSMARGGSGGTKPSISCRIGCTTGCSRVSAKASSSSLDRQTLVLGIIQQAAAEPELAALRTEIAERRAANMRLFVADLAAAASLRLDQGEAADIVWATNSAEMYQLLVGQRGWTPQRYERFLTDTWQRVLLAG